MGKISEKAKKIDLYASRPVLSFGKDGKIYSRLGLLLTFLTIVIIGGMAIWVGIRIFGRQTPSFIQYELPAKVQNQKLPWNTDDFTFALSLGVEEESRLVRLKPFYMDGQTYTEYPITVETCYFDHSPGTAYKCFAQSESSKDKTYLDIVGIWSFIIDYDYCQNTEIYYDCYSEEQAKQIMVDSQISFFFVYDDLLIDPFNFENPMTVSPSLYTDLIMLDVPRILVVELNEIEFTTDNGWIFEDLKTETKLKASISMKVSNRGFLNVELKYGGNKTVYKRTYPKIQDFFAQISGFITIITPIFLILVAPYGNLQAVQQMVNEIYEIKLTKPNNGGDSPQKPFAKKKRLSTKYKSMSSKSNSPVSAKHTEADLVPEKISVSRKNKVHLPPIHSKNASNIPHETLDIQPVEKSQTKEENLPPPAENVAHSHPLETFDQSPSSPFISSSKPAPKNYENDHIISPETQGQGNLLEHAKVHPQGQPQAAEEMEDNEADGQNPEDPEWEDIPLRTSDRLEVPWQVWLKSFFKPDPQVQVLNKAKEHIMETFDLLTLSKKAIEIDKLKACLLTHDQRVIFENLPSSVIVLDHTANLKSDKAIQQYHWKESCKGDEKALRKAYSNLIKTNNPLDQRLLRLYESEYLDDGDGDAMVLQEESS